MRRRAALLALHLLVGSASAELTLRAYAALSPRWDNPPAGSEIEDFAELLRPSAHPEIGLELRPGLDVDFRGGPLRTNAAGFRGGPRSKRKPAGVTRIIGVGDSVMMGWGVGQGEDYLSALERSLRAGGVDAEALNFGVGGYNTTQEYFVLRDVAMEYEPDLVVLGYVGNDLNPPNFSRPNRRFDSPSALLNLAALAWDRRMGRIAPEQTRDWRPFRRKLGVVPGDFKESLAAIAALCRERGIPAVMVLDSRYESPLISHQEVGRLARDLGFATLDLLSLYRHLKPGTPVSVAAETPDAHNRELILEGDRHPNARWHRKTARALEALLRERGLVPKKALDGPRANPGP